MKKKWFSAFLAVLFAGLIAIPEYAYATTNNDYDYTVYDMETGKVTHYRINDPSAVTDDALETMSEQVLAGENSGVSPRVIVGGDNRIRVTNTTYRPYSYTVHIAITTATGATTTGSGVVIGSNAILTAAHVVCNIDGYARSLTITPGKNGNSAPYGSFTVTSADFYIPYTYTSALPSTQPPHYYPGPDYDWAIIYLDESDDIGNYTGWPALCPQAANYSGLTVKCIGYPSDEETPLQDEGNNYMFESSGTIHNIYDNIFTGDWDAVVGNSGGPLLVNNPTAGWTLYGIFVSTRGINGNAYDEDETYSCGRKIAGTLWYLCNELGGAQ